MVTTAPAVMAHLRPPDLAGDLVLASRGGIGDVGASNDSTNAAPVDPAAATEAVAADRS